MVYKKRYTNSTMRVDTDQIAKRYLNGGTLYVHTDSSEERTELVEFLEREGLRCLEDNVCTRQGILGSRFPLSIDLNGKNISCIGNNTCAAAAAGCGLVISSREFYLLHSLSQWEAIS